MCLRAVTVVSHCVGRKERCSRAYVRVRVCVLAGSARRFITGSTSPERLQPAWCPGPFIPGRDWTRASRRVGLQQFCRAQTSLPAQSEPLAGRDICCLTFLIYTSPPSHTNTRLRSPPSQTSLSRSRTEGRGKRENGVRAQTERERESARPEQRDMFNGVLGNFVLESQQSVRRVSVCLPPPPSIL